MHSIGVDFPDGVTSTAHQYVNGRGAKHTVHPNKDIICKFIDFVKLLQIKDGAPVIIPPNIEPNNISILSTLIVVYPITAAICRVECPKA